MGTWKRYLPFAFAVLFAALSSLSAYQFLKDRGNVSHAATAGDTMPVVVAKVGIPLGKKLTEQDLKVLPWPRDAVPTESFSSVRPLVGRIVKSDIIEDEPVLSAKLIGDGENFSSLIPSNMRGVTVPVRYSRALKEILQRGTTVDVISMTEHEIGPPRTTVIAQKVRVLAVHGEGAGLGQDRDSRDMEVVLIVTPRQAGSLVTAMNHGVIQLAVRNEVDEASGSIETMR
ncbi:MAG: Flp pilus assembly protein CpaB [Candidatus Omnitrophica bacterium]|nr:Flp pilus assembly protein CpaB [Candidatus Omnitrophota bacterium]